MAPTDNCLLYTLDVVAECDVPVAPTNNCLPYTLDVVAEYDMPVGPTDNCLPYTLGKERCSSRWTGSGWRLEDISHTSSVEAANSTVEDNLLKNGEIAAP